MSFWLNISFTICGNLMFFSCKFCHLFIRQWPFVLWRQDSLFTKGEKKLYVSYKLVFYFLSEWKSLNCFSMTKQPLKMKQLKKIFPGQGWWYMPGIPAVGRLRQENCHEFKVSLDHAVETLHQKTKTFPNVVLLWVTAQILTFFGISLNLRSSVLTL